MRESSSKFDGHIQAIEGSTPMLCCALHALNIISTWLIGNSLLDAINQVHPLVKLSEISFGLLCCVPEEITLCNKYSANHWDQAHHVLTVCVMKHGTICKLPSEILAIITDNSGTMGYVQKEDVDEAVRQGSGGGICHKFLGLNDTKISRAHVITPRTHMNSAYHQAQVVASELCNKRSTRNSLKVLSLPPAMSTSDS